MRDFLCKKTTKVFDFLFIALYLNHQTIIKMNISNESSRWKHEEKGFEVIDTVEVESSRRDIEGMVECLILRHEKTGQVIAMDERGGTSEGGIIESTHAWKAIREFHHQLGRTMNITPQTTLQEIKEACEEVLNSYSDFKGKRYIKLSEVHSIVDHLIQGVTGVADKYGNVDGLLKPAAWRLDLTSGSFMIGQDDYYIGLQPEASSPLRYRLRDEKIHGRLDNRVKFSGVELFVRQGVELEWTLEEYVFEMIKEAAVLSEASAKERVEDLEEKLAEAQRNFNEASDKNDFVKGQLSDVVEF